MMGGGVNTSEMFEKLESMRAVVTEVNTQFKNPDLTTFIPVMSTLLFFPAQPSPCRSSPSLS